MKNSVVLIIPTGIGAEIGGHAGDANPVAFLLGSLCENLITHPNVVNGSDINEQPINTLYVEGSMLDRFLEGEIGLQKINSNKIIVAINKPVHNETINAVSAARVTLGIDAKILPLETPLKMKGFIANGIATGEVKGWEELVKQVKQHDFDALAIASEIDVEDGVALNYFRNGGINPWGGIEAIASKLISNSLNKPVAHAPVESENTKTDSELFKIAYNEIVDPRMTPEIISCCYIHCVLKGLQRAPRIGNDITFNNVLCMVTPINCVGRPHHACMKQGIPIIAVKENKVVLNDPMPDSFIIVENYLEVAGIISSLKCGVVPESVRRPIKNTTVIE